MQEFLEALQVSAYIEPAFIDIITFFSVYTRLIAELSYQYSSKIAQFVANRKPMYTNFNMLTMNLQ